MWNLDVLLNNVQELYVNRTVASFPGSLLKRKKVNEANGMGCWYVVVLDLFQASNNLQAWNKDQYVRTVGS